MNAYYTFSPAFSYAKRTGLLLKGGTLNLKYGMDRNAPDAPNVFLPDADLHTIQESGGKLLMTNHAYSN